ncbi:MAG: PQQ-binding-like beta-propeller repeat protein [Chloroflexi bacterium]|nr:PQQ-binding-like beta-propeller repeat protein [Chloroflexota bacterium]
MANGRVFLSTEDGRALAFDQDTGQVKWEYHSGFPSGAVPSVAGDLV